MENLVKVGGALAIGDDQLEETIKLHKGIGYMTNVKEIDEFDEMKVYEVELFTSQEDLY